MHFALKIQCDDTNMIRQCNYRTNKMWQEKLIFELHFTFQPNYIVTIRVLALMKNINDNALALMFKMVNE